MQIEGKSKVRLEWLDVLRGIAMYLVVIGHATKTMPGNYRYYIYSFHMPLFFIISGASYYFQTKSKEFDFKEMLKIKARTLVWPYFTLNFFAFWIWILNFRILSYRDTSIPKLIYAIFYANQDHISASSNATWFLLTLFLTTMVFYILQMWSENDEKNLTLIIGVIGAFGYAMSLRSDRFASPWHLETIPIALIFFLMGYLFIKHIDFMMKLLGNQRKQIIICVCCFIGAFFCAKYNVKISMASNRYGSFMLFMGSVIGFSIVCMLISMWIPKFSILKYIGKNTLTYLAFHAPIYWFIKLSSETTKNLLGSYPIVVGTIVFILMIPIAWIFDKFFPVLLGRKVKKDK